MVFGIRIEDGDGIFTVCKFRMFIDGVFLRNKLFIFDLKFYLGSEKIIYGMRKYL